MWKIADNLNKDYDPYKSKLGQREFQFVGRDGFSGERFWVDLKDCIKAMFDGKTCRIYKF